jgi:outer membrane usher protein
VVALALGAYPRNAAAAAACQGQPAPLALSVGTVARGVVVVILGGDDVWVPDDVLRAAGIATTNATRCTAFGVTYASLRSFGRLLTYRYDPAAAAVDIRPGDVTALAAPVHVVDAASTRLQTQPASSVPSGYLTYDLTSSSQSGLPGTTAIYLETGVSANSWRFTTTNDVDGTSWRRGLYDLTFDADSALRTLQIGDTFTDATDPLASSVVLTGLSVSRNFNLQPDFLRYPTAALSGVVLAPTTADVYVNGGLYRTLTLQPGPFSLENLNLPEGANVTQVVLQNPYGGATTLGMPFYSALDVLAPGVTSYSYNLGFVRPDPFGLVDSLGSLATSDAYRIGLSRTLTAGLNLEATHGLVDGGPNLSFRLPIGQIDALGAFSNAGGVTGRAGSVAYSYVGARWAAEAGVLTQSDVYATLALAPESDRATSTLSESASYRTSPWTTIAIAHADAHDRQFGMSDQLTATASVRGANGVGWIVDLTRTQGSFLAIGTANNSPSWGLGGGMNLTLGGGRELQAQTGIGSNETSSVSYTQTSSSTPGSLGWSALAQSGQGSTALSATGVYHTPLADVQLGLSDATGGSTALIGLAGSIAIFNQGVFFTPPLQAAYGLVQVDGPPHLPVTAGGIVAGTTDGRGDLVLPNLTPFVDNQITLGNLGNYPNYQVDTPEQTVVPQTDAGVVTTFHVRPVLFVIGTVRIQRHGEMLIPRYGLLTLELPNGSKTSDLGTNAEFYFEGVPAGRYRATVSLGELRCGFSLTVPRSDAVQTTIGEQLCSLP